VHDEMTTYATKTATAKNTKIAVFFLGAGFLEFTSSRSPNIAGAVEICDIINQRHGGTLVFL